MIYKNKREGYSIMNKMNRLIRYARDNTIHYKKIPSDFDKNEWGIIPFISREELYDYTKFISKEYSVEQLVKSSTSGSTGKVLSVYWNRDDLYASYLSLWRVRNREYNILPTDRRCQFHTVSETNYNTKEGYEISSPRAVLSKDKRVLSFSKIDLNNDILFGYYKKVNEFRPKWFFSQPSTMFLFSSFIIKNNLSALEFVEFIELTGEYLEASYLTMIKSAFPKAIIANNYGCQEVNGIAYTCKCGNMHCLEDNVFVEIVKSKKDCHADGGNICVTSLRNWAMPIIRYKLDDIGYFERDKVCDCGSRNRILKLIAGRNNDLPRLKGMDVDATIFYYLIQKINEDKDLVQQFQVIQESEKEFIVYLILVDTSLNNYVKKIFLENVREQNLFSDCFWTFRFVDRIDNIESKLFYFKKNF